MGSFETATAYVPKDSDVFFDDGREVELLHFIHNKPDIDSIRGSPARVLEAIDEFARTKKYLMNVGAAKGKIVTDLIAEVKPKTMVELGGYCGYSCILFGAAVRASSPPGSRYISLERSPEFAAVIMCLVALAGLSSTISVIVGSSDASLKRLHASGELKHIDLMFLDHYKPAYTTDLKWCEELGIVTVGSVLAADNVITPGNPPYLEYVRSSVKEKREAAARAPVEGDGVDARFPGRTAQQYAKRLGQGRVDLTAKGNPNLVYESRIHHSFEPTGEPDGIEITRCVGEGNEQSNL